MARRGREQQLLPVAVALANPEQVEAHTLITLLTDGGALIRRPMAAAAVTPDAHQCGHRRRGRIVFHHGQTDLEIAVDRTMTWANGTGSHAEGAAASPGRHWYFAEGATHGSLTSSTIQNPSAAPASVTVNYYGRRHCRGSGALTPCRLTAGSPSGWTRPVRGLIDRRLRRDHLQPEHRRRARHVHGRWRNAFPRRPCGGGRFGPRPGVASGRGRYRRLLRPVPAHRQPDRQAAMVEIDYLLPDGGGAGSSRWRRAAGNGAG